MNNSMSISMNTGDLQKAQAPALASADDARLASVRRAADKGDTKQTAKEFEKLFAVMLVRELRRSMPESPFGEGAGADVYEGWFDEHLGSSLAQRDVLGIARMVGTSLGRTQAARDAAEAAEKGS